uniref:Uncharacterized protein n=1 Tax=Acrobeloides nanus TaxID=290746 RepID=A0A914C3E5_9BILA
MIRALRRTRFPTVLKNFNANSNARYCWKARLMISEWCDYQSTSGEYHKRYSRESDSKGSKNSHNRNNNFYTFTGASMGVSIFAAVMDMFGIKKIQLDDDPLKDKIKQARVSRKLKQYENAIGILHESLIEASNRKDDPDSAVTYVLDELANTYYEKGDIEEADKNFREVLKRLVQLHGKKDSDPEFIGISLKLADLFAQKGEFDNADIGFRHCITKQMHVMEDHLQKFHVNKGAWTQEINIIEAHGRVYTDPIALFGMCLELYAHFLLQHGGEKRLKEAEEYMDEVLKISSHIYGTSSYHMINVLNNFGAASILKN